MGWFYGGGGEAIQSLEKSAPGPTSLLPAFQAFRFKVVALSGRVPFCWPNSTGEMGVGWPMAEMAQNQGMTC